jgi:hypothetical protein
MTWSSKPLMRLRALAHELGIEARVAVARGVDLDRPVFAHDGLARMAVARICAVAPLGRAFGVAEVVGHLGLEGALDQRLLQLVDETLFAEQLLVVAGVSHQFIDQLVADGHRLVLLRLCTCTSDECLLHTSSYTLHVSARVNASVAPRLVDFSRTIPRASL